MDIRRFRFPIKFTFAYFCKCCHIHHLYLLILMKNKDKISYLFPNKKLIFNLLRLYKKTFLVEIVQLFPKPYDLQTPFCNQNNLNRSELIFHTKSKHSSSKLCLCQSSDDTITIKIISDKFSSYFIGYQPSVEA